MEKVRSIEYFKEYFHDFYKFQDEKVKWKINEILYYISYSERISGKFFEHIQGTEGLYCIRIEYRGNIYRIFCCFDEGRLIVLFNGFQKKSRKTPANEISRALEIKKEYFENKKH